MPVAYRDKIVEAFRDNAIKSVLLIDDQYLPYENLASRFTELLGEIDSVSSDTACGKPDSNVLKKKLEQVRKFVDSAGSDFMVSDAARNFVGFFHDRKLICDVENETNSLDKDKIRKSDLIVLDYYLEDQAINPNPAERSLNLISDLSQSKHMNLIVVYTAEPLNKVWSEISATLRGTHIGNDEAYFGNADLLSQWRTNSADWEDEWDYIYNASVEADFLTGEHDLEGLLRTLIDACEEKEYEQPVKEHVSWLLEKKAQDFNKNNISFFDRPVHGKRNLWLQAGDVFVVLCEKNKQIEGVTKTRDVTPEELWEQIKTALESWYPSFYRVVTSELQNQIEDANLSMEKVLSKGKVEQIAALWGVLRVHQDDRDKAARELLDTMLSDVVDKVQSSSELLNFVRDAANSIDDELPEFVSRESNPGNHTNYLKAIVASASKNYTHKDEDIDASFRCQVLHAFNEQLSTEKELPDHISTGVVLKDIGDSSYYLCIAPSCNTVPKQTTGKVAERMTPHRPMRFIKLENKTKNLDKCLNKAHQSDTIFISDQGKRLALSIYEQGDTPTIEQGVVLNHDTDLIGAGGHKLVQFFETNEHTKQLEVVDKKLMPITRLRPSFASRYQNAQLQYEARIGVDLVSANMK